MSLDLTRKTRFYQACSGCRREFFSREEFEGHPCFRNRSTFDVNNILGASGKVVTVKGAESLGDRKAEVLANSNPNTGVAEAADTVATDIRLEAVREVTKMKQELVMAGIEAQTMTTEQTKAEYAKFKAEQAAKEEQKTETAAPAATVAAAEPTEKKTTKRKSSR